MECPEGGETTIPIRVTNISQCNGTAPPYDVNITAGNDYAIFHANGTKIHIGQTLSITNSSCENANTFLFFVVVTADHPVVVKATMVNVLQNGTGKYCRERLVTHCVIRSTNQQLYVAICISCTNFQRLGFISQTRLPAVAINVS